MSDIEVRRLDFGYFVRPAEETGTGSARVEDPCTVFFAHDPRSGRLRSPTGPTESLVRRSTAAISPRSRRAASKSAGLEQVTLVTNCHLHFDHCGGNPRLGDRPVFVQTTELSTARKTEDYTLPELIEGRRYEELDGEAEVLPGVFLIPTPGHTDGHQSLMVQRRDGNVIVARQSHDTATAYSADLLSRKAHRDGHAELLPPAPLWMDRLQAFDPRIVFFAHDHSVWTP